MNVHFDKVQIADYKHAVADCRKEVAQFVDVGKRNFRTKIDYEKFVYRVFKYNFEGYYSDDDYDMFGSNDYDYDDDELFDATADLLSNHPEKKRSHAEMDDTFKMDVIDLD